MLEMHAERLNVFSCKVSGNVCSAISCTVPQKIGLDVSKLCARDEHWF